MMAIPVYHEHQLHNTFTVDITNIEGRARGVAKMLYHMEPVRAFALFKNWLTKDNLSPVLQRTITGALNPTILCLTKDEIRYTTHKTINKPK